MFDGGKDTVLLVCGDESISNDILNSLHEYGFGVVGPTTRAATALALTAQTAPTVAVIASALTGRRSATELAESLMATWGVRSWIWSGESQAEIEADLSPVWAVTGDQLNRLRFAFDGSGQHQAA